jgi:hypothetical protein
MTFGKFLLWQFLAGLILGIPMMLLGAVVTARQPR